MQLATPPFFFADPGTKSRDGGVDNGPRSAALGSKTLTGLDCCTLPTAVPGSHTPAPLGLLPVIEAPRCLVVVSQKPPSWWT